MTAISYQDIVLSVFATYGITHINNLARGYFGPTYLFGISIQAVTFYCLFESGFFKGMF